MSLNDDFRFSKNSRLTSKEGFARVFSKAKRSSDKFLTVLSKKNDCNPARLGFALAKKNVKRATQRNKIRRVVRESFRLTKQRLIGHDFVVLGNKSAVSANKLDLSRSIETHWKKLTANE